MSTSSLDGQITADAAHVARLPQTGTGSADDGSGGRRDADHDEVPGQHDERVPPCLTDAKAEGQETEHLRRCPTCRREFSGPE